jgi:cell division protein FtsL
MRLLSLIAFGFLAGLIVLIYEMKFETRRLEARAADLERAIVEEKDNVALMRAEWSHVTRPERIEALARDILKLDAAKPAQLVTHRDFFDALSRRPVPPAAEAKVWRPRDEIGALIRGEGGNHAAR